MAGFNETPKGERLHIAFFGRRNAGKSSLVNAFTGQELAIVSDVKGTTTDPVYKAMELLPLGPVMIVDTPGIDDEGDLGALRIKKTQQVLNKTDLAVIVTDSTQPISRADENLIAAAKEREIPYLIVWNKADLLDTVPDNTKDSVWVSAKAGTGIEELKNRCALLAQTEENKRRIVGDLLEAGDVVVLVVPIDKAAPKGRLILPQQQTIRDVLDAGACAVVCRDTELLTTLENLVQPPRLVITDSQVFGKVSKILPREIPLTSFSMLMARYKGNLPLAVVGASAIDTVKAGDRILIAEGCTHHRQCEDIGTVKLPNWIRNHLGFEPIFEFVSGTEFPEDLHAYRLVVHCGGCMLNERDMRYRLRACQDADIPVTNYGTLIAYLNGILPRTLEPFPDIASLLTSKKQ
ncbi:MAG: [Clostridia bacterium]|nr:[FeFe] hydrogenase H-cluster maturation GTPase HydF [Clostridia bacterium]